MCSRPEFKWSCIIQAMIGHQLHLNICLEQHDKLAVAEHIFNQHHNIQLCNTKSSLSHLTTWISSSGGNWDEAPSQNGKGGWPNRTWLMTSHLHPYRTQNPQHNGWYAHSPFQDQKIVLSLPPILSFSPYPGDCFIVTTIILINLLSLTSLPSSPIPWWLFHCAIINWTWLHWPFSAPHHPCCSATVCSCQTFTAHTVPVCSSIHTHTHAHALTHTPARARAHTHSQYSSCTAQPWR